MIEVGVLGKLRQILGSLGLVLSIAHASNQRIDVVLVVLIVIVIIVGVVIVRVDSSGFGILGGNISTIRTIVLGQELVVLVVIRRVLDGLFEGLLSDLATINGLAMLTFIFFFLDFLVNID